MCYSAQILADYRRYVRMFGAHMSIRTRDIIMATRPGSTILCMSEPDALRIRQVCSGFSISPG
ncbi:MULTISPECIES: hypothetical protein [Paraburkholderia]|uniref:Uncharacterized protein n=1 Tax=Paraburkholderia tuberum TaxID=157910 RepID=A0A1H1GM21_9BURK|nr:MULTISPECIES: hypothetical protein [Paraburkholderia]MBC8720739.1 hypothetical protein [Paraburkholderia sp. 31.1]SDR14274.1 hypothetical protein SAMN05445850_2973 [Paraburkholderia tuberum]